MSNGLVPFEKKVESWEVIHPRRWIATADRNQVANFLSAQTRSITETQLKAADRIVVSQDRIVDKIDDAIVASRDMAGGIEELQATFEWGFTELIWQIEQEREVLKDILKILQAPLDTEAKELKKRAEYAYKNGWIGDAFEDFLESEKKNRYDFTIHQNLGNIYLFKKKDPGNALEYYEKAVKYATPKSSYYTSISLLHMGLLKYLQEDFRGAYEATSKAIELSPNLYEAHFQHAQYCVKLGKYDEAIRYLRKAIVDGDRYYCVKANSEKDFNIIKKQMRSLFKELRDEARSQAKLAIREAEELSEYAKSYAVEDTEFLTAEEKLKKARIFLRRGSLFDCWDALNEAHVAEKLIAQSLVGYLYEEIERLKDKTSRLISKIEKEKEGFQIVIGFIYLIVTILITALSKLSAGSKAGWISLFVITSPVIGIITGNIIAERKVLLGVPPLIARKNKLENEFLETKAKRDQLRREEDKIIPRGFRPKVHKTKPINQMTYDEWKKWKEKEGENSKISEDWKHFEETREQLHESSYEEKEANYEELANKIGKKCPSCGEIMKIDHKYCLYCGTKWK